ncbi:respiratory-subunit NADH dehydrogenase subunit [Caldicellulosiruptor bescii]|jgi:NADH:ubiquinone oxidoreductase subunit C|uniref:NADH dehydrogenase (Ubiquinone) 30 kDa subunit n=2 Tax=Caldicellulosiruptor bescii TaxID=31899 RepID=B9MR82_CALBD|nr:NADH-quinone oxidoreductase subunit C [Caldicellulosiruptor bescii]ACM60186.1 NADH dehydrogenase (ubiquinone) 30 kDa subunit [Caldicellulosiruptor bescii DSM 6725]PBC87601.1 respiratory-subunit NADH dehydrogenase subunit [Caldicellulosiruptor bescii]PBC90534.1 respiratory-subunit NADH dehydrogenase subunit [Caldicellulosiruptor bescii]PBD04034.1 respiratory-subunit NADH dehydrogenase subunit [Caldicellulosiruptor bescii]PBD06331.1 respiratory-subunit NADH dehydrogenase subunit [Caldicellulo
MLQNLKELQKEDLRKEVLALKADGYRFVTATCVDLGDGRFDIIYHFDKDYRLTNIRITAQAEEKVPSISDIYFAAVFVENEIKDLFGIEFENLLIDYEGKFMITEELESPMRKKPVVKVKKGE